jgi:hypothetical protein
MEGGGVEGEKKMCGTATGFCLSSGPVKMHEREVGTVTGSYCYGGHCCTGWPLLIPGVLFTGSVLCSGRVLFMPEGTVHMIR